MGTLYIVSTPIGNLSDITLRALLTLKSVDYILCEDTRNTGRLLKTYQINKKMVSFNEFNEDAKSTAVIEDLLKDTKVALVSDAGTPLVSDPGFKLVREAVTKGIKVESIPGPTAVGAEFHKWRSARRFPTQTIGRCLAFHSGSPSRSLGCSFR